MVWCGGGERRGPAVGHSFGGGGLTVVVHMVEMNGEEGSGERREEREMGVGEFFNIKCGAGTFRNN